MKRRSTPFLAVLLCTLSGFGGLGWAAPASAADPTPAVSMTKDRPYYVAGQTERITVVVTGVDGSSGGGKGLRISADLPNGTTKVLGQTSAYDDTFHFSYGVYVNHTLHAEVFDSTGVLASDDLTVVQLAKLSTEPKGGYLGYSGSYVVFPRGASPVFRSRDLTGRVAPRCLRHEVQRRYASGWKRAFTSACRAEQTTVVDWKWLRKHPSGVRFRVRATFAGDAWNHASRAPWKYFKFR